MDLKSEKALALRGHYRQQEPCRQVTAPPAFTRFSTPANTRILTKLCQYLSFFKSQSLEFIS